MYVVIVRKGFGGIPYGQLLINCVPCIKVIYECGSLVGEAYIALPGYQKETGCPDHMRVNHIIQFTVALWLDNTCKPSNSCYRMEGLMGLDFCGSIYRDQCAHCYMYMYMYMYM